jgi:hypothetical protein
LLVLLAGVCIAAGTLARFWELGRWPLAIDEYYFAKSVQNVLHFGIPRFPCGGFYVRGLLLQYASAALQGLGLSAELAPRLLAAVSSLVALPAIYKIARRVGGEQVALLAIAILGLSVWEVEMSRFGRMYAPFQAIFLWYVVFFLKYVIDGERRAVAPMLVLSAMGFAVWEGGIFLVLTNLLPPFIAHPDGRITRRDWAYLIACSLLLIPAYMLTMADLRMASSEPALPPDYVEPPDTPSPSRLDTAVMPLSILHSHLGWALAAVLPLLLVLYAAFQEIRAELTPSGRPLGALCVLAVLACAATQQFELAAGLILIFVLLGMLDRRRLLGVASRPLQLALLACFLFWTVFGLAANDWLSPGTTPLHKAFLLGYEFVRFPDSVRQVAMPWARTVPLLTIGLFVLVAACCVRAWIYLEDTPQLERVLLALFVLLLLAASASNPPRHETRYIYFLFPFAIVFSLLTITRAARAILGPTRIGALVAIVTCLAAFVLSEDFRPYHLWNIGSEAINFRLGMAGRLKGHYHPRSDIRAAAEYVQARAKAGQDLVIISYPGVDFYVPQADYYFVSEDDPRFDVWSCSRGTRQRWSNLPMIYSYDTLVAKATSGRRVWMILETMGMQRVLAALPAGTWTLEWTAKTRDIVVVSIHEPTHQG